MTPEEIRSMTQKLATKLFDELEEYPTQIAFIFDRIYLRHHNLNPERQFEVVRENCGKKSADNAQALQEEYLNRGTRDREAMKAEAKQIFEEEYRKHGLDFTKYYYTPTNHTLNGISFDAIVGDIKLMADGRRNQAAESAISGLNSNGALDRLSAMGVSISFTPSYTSAPSRYQDTPRQIMNCVIVYPPSITVEGKFVDLSKFAQERVVGPVRSIYPEENWKYVKINGVRYEVDEILAEAFPCKITSMSETPPGAVIEGVEVDLAKFAESKKLGNIWLLYNTGTAIRINGFEYTGYELKKYAETLKQGSANKM